MIVASKDELLIQPFTLSLKTTAFEIVPNGAVDQSTCIELVVEEPAMTPPFTDHE